VKVEGRLVTTIQPANHTLLHVILFVNKTPFIAQIH